MDEHFLQFALWIATFVLGAWYIAWGTHRHGFGRFGLKLLSRSVAIIGMAFLIGLVVVEFMQLNDFVDEATWHAGVTDLSLERTGPFVTSYYIERPRGGSGMYRDVTEPIYSAAIYFVGPTVVLSIIAWGTLRIVTSRPTEVAERSVTAL